MSDTPEISRATSQDICPESTCHWGGASGSTRHVLFLTDVTLVEESAQDGLSNADLVGEVGMGQAAPLDSPLHTLC